MNAHRLAVVLVLGLLLAVPAASAATSWTHTGYDPARTGHVPTQGPQSTDVALQVELPGTLATDWLYMRPGPLIHDGSAYVPLKAFEMDGVETEDRNDTMQGVVRVDLDTGEVEPVITLDQLDFVRSIAIDGERLYISIRDWPDKVHVEAYDLATWEQAWTWGPHYVFEQDATVREANTLDNGNRGSQTCSHLIVHDGTLYHFCNQQREETFRQETYLVALDARSGEDHWLWESTMADEDGTPREGASPSFSVLTGISVIGDHLLASGWDAVGVGGSGCIVTGTPGLPCEDHPSMQYQNGSLHLTAFEPGPDGGEIRWSHKRAVSLTEVGAAGQDRSLGDQDTFQGISAHTTGTQSVLYTRMLDQVLALNPGQDGEEIWSETVGAFDAQTNASFGGLALGDNAFYATSTETLYRYDTNPHHNRWRTVLDPSYDEKWANGDIILADETLYAAAEWRHGNGTSIYAVDAETGDILWRKPIPSDPAIAEQKPWRLFHYISVADGLLVAAGGDGTLWVLGETDASIAPAVKVSSAYPGPGEEVDVDLSGSGPGLQGNVTRYKADWGDGNTTGWQTDPVLTYAYTAPGDRTARFWVGNDANQTSSVTHTFHVGQEAPTEPNMVETAFARENQDLTFGVLGILVAVTGGAIGVARRYRERSRLQEELEAIEHLFEATRDRPAECEAQLTERKAHCRGLLTDGYLTEEQFQVVQTRVEELKQELRRGAVEDEFAFLPHGLVREAREMLHDGRVTSLEARAFLTALEESEVVTDEQRALVRDRIEAWYARDAGGGGRP